VIHKWPYKGGWSQVTIAPEPRSDAGPLAGLRVLEISSFVAAPLGGMTLAQLGADVIRIDPPGGAADQHRWPLAASGASLYWAGLNKGKRSMMINMRAEAGREVIRDLLKACPPGTAVVLTNAPGQEWLGYAALTACCGDLIHVQIDGNSDGSAAVDYTVNAEVGFPLVTGPAGHADPVNHVLPAWDIACGLYAALGVSAAARRRAVNGAGSAVRIALADVALAMAGNLGFLAEAQVNGADRERIGNYLYGGFGRDFGCRDGGRLMVVALTARHWRDLVTLTGMTGPVSALEQALQADFGTDGDRFEYREVLAGLFQRWFAARTAAEAASALSQTSLLWAPYRSFRQAVEALRAAPESRPIVSEIDQPGIGRHLAPGLPLMFAGDEAPARIAPLLGQHTRAVLAAELGLAEAEIDVLCADQVVRAAEPDHAR
jgi:2-methylfumaryl-CoA isomerase